MTVFPEGFFARADESPDGRFYEPPRFVTHIDDRAIHAVGELYDELGLRGRVLDLMASWISHFRAAPDELTVLGMNAAELRSNRQASHRVIHDLNSVPSLPFATRSFDAVTCCVSVDYLVRPVEVFTDVARVLVPGAPFVLTFSNRCFPTKAIRGWLATSDEQHCALVAAYFEQAGSWSSARAELRTEPGTAGDPLYAVWAETRPSA